MGVLASNTMASETDSKMTKTTQIISHTHNKTLYCNNSLIILTNKTVDLVSLTIRLQFSQDIVMFQANWLSKCDFQAISLLTFYIILKSVS